MGLDIHFYVEYNINNVWVPHPSHDAALKTDQFDLKFVRGGLEMGRNSMFFEFLMRTLRRGIPVNISSTIGRLYKNNNKVGVHGECYGSLRDYENAIVCYNNEMLTDWEEEEMCFDDEVSFVKVISDISHKGKLLNAQDIRLIFWFDH